MEEKEFVFEHDVHLSHMVYEFSKEFSPQFQKMQKQLSEKTVQLEKDRQEFQEKMSGTKFSIYSYDYTREQQELMCRLGERYQMLKEQGEDILRVVRWFRQTALEMKYIEDRVHEYMDILKKQEKIGQEKLDKELRKKKRSR